MDQSVVSRRLGQLDREPFPRLFLGLFRKRFTGAAVLARPSGEQATCRFVNGLLVDIELAGTSTVADVLRDLGLVDDLAHLKMPAASERPVVEQLSAARGAGVEEEAVWRAYRLFMRRRIIKLCGWGDGMYELRPDALAAGASMATMDLSPTIPRQRCLDPLPELLHGVSEACDEARLRRELAGADGCTVALGAAASPELLARLALGKAESDLIEKVRSSSFMVDDLVRMGKLPQRRVLAILWMLSLMGVLDLKPNSVVTTRAGGGATSGSTAAAPPSGARPIVASPEQPRAPSSGKSNPGYVPPLSAATSATRPSTGLTHPGFAFPPPTSSGQTNPGTAQVVAPPPAPAAPRAPGAPPPIPAAALVPPPASTSTLPELPFEGVAMRNAILEKAAVVEGQDLFAVIGLTTSANAVQIREAYMQLVKTFHPDRLATYQLDRLRPVAERVFQRISQAYATLSDEKRRKDYLATLKIAGTEAAADPTALLMEAEGNFQKGEAALRRKDYGKAVEHFKLAVTMNADEAEHHAALGWALFSAAPDTAAKAKDKAKTDEAIALLQKAIDMQPQLVRAYYYLGEVFLAQGDLDRAVGPLKKVLEIQTDHVEALRSMRIVQMRLEKRAAELKEAKKTSGGLLDRLRKR